MAIIFLHHSRASVSFCALLMSALMCLCIYANDFSWLAFEGQDFAGRMYVLEVGSYSDLRAMGCFHAGSSILSLQTVGFVSCCCLFFFLYFFLVRLLTPTLLLVIRPFHLDINLVRLQDCFRGRETQYIQNLL